MIVDNILFSNEFDMLELRLSIMGDLVDRIVIVECDHTFTNIYKGYNLENIFHRFAKWADKILYIKVQSPKFSNPWDNEFWQRDQFVHGWSGLTNEDVIMISDCDEIVRPESLEYIKNSNHNYYGIVCPIFYFKFNYLNIATEYTVWPVAYRNALNMRPSQMRRIPDERQRHKPHDSVFIHHGGWHFSWAGNDDFVRNKLKSFSHTEYNTPSVINNVNVEKLIEENKEHMGIPNAVWNVVKFDEYFPQFILQNKEKYKDYIWKDGEKTVTDYYGVNVLQIESV